MTAPEFIDAERRTADIQRAEGIERTMRYEPPYVRNEVIDALRSRMKAHSCEDDFYALLRHDAVAVASKVRARKTVDDVTLTVAIDAVIHRIDELRNENKTVWNVVLQEFDSLRKGAGCGSQ